MYNFSADRYTELMTPKKMRLGQKVLRRYKLEAIRRREYRKLKSIVPSVAAKKSVSKLTVIEEAIKYIDHLHAALATKIFSIDNGKFSNKSSHFADSLIESIVNQPPIVNYNRSEPQQQPFPATPSATVSNPATNRDPPATVAPRFYFNNHTTVVNNHPVVVNNHPTVVIKDAEKKRKPLADVLVSNTNFDNIAQYPCRTNMYD